MDSRTILDQSGAESLLGHGDMLFLQPGTSVPVRVHGAFVSDQEVHRVVGSLRSTKPPVYIDEILEGPSAPIPGLPGEQVEGAGEDGGDAEQDPLYDEAVRIVTESRKASISGVQRRLKIGYNRAARMIETMEAAGLVGPLQTNGSREVLAPPPPEVGVKIAGHVRALRATCAALACLRARIVRSTRPDDAVDARRGLPVRRQDALGSSSSRSCATGRAGSPSARAGRSRSRAPTGSAGITARRTSRRSSRTGAGCGSTTPICSR